ncbi:hypothetical protein VDF98_20095 [Xanthomonas campestris pv. raphani]|uniref:tetratricopeptide repeat protein n=1 Tax=Xanthomonas TaxID=338 RepID=UPI0011B0366B|nr:MULTISPECIES: hypothetical protein [Xanthomonas]MCE4347987.1 hypothetical protein [Xanthomonas hortorum pv. cynarae]MEA9825733.1 hypothetical protein [Xanthomonas campestris pv. raphani]MEA9853997.1 hypothetical protein [Xanthomonas campestris pv. raphani]MEA9858201.1 hypothetical protein [Xanthomonas campestris pv. raphani]MEA9967186.1 hypothetical protein [Xanthomonas campestris pv. raphani]
MPRKNSLIRSKEVWAGNLLAERIMLSRWRSPSGAAAAGERSGNSEVMQTKAPNSEKWRRVLQEAHKREDQTASRDLAETDYLLGTIGGPSWNESLAPLQQLWDKAITLQHLAEHGRAPLVNSNPQEVARASIGRIRQQLNKSQRQPLLWSELARHHLILGQDNQAISAMTCALQLARGHAYITRAAARLYVHLDKSDEALSIIRRNPLFRSDPRLMASEISLSSGTRISGAWHAAAQRIITNSNYRPSFVGELEAALATVEMTNGKHKRARTLFSSSMEHPSENSLAQAQWAKERDAKIIIPPSAWNVPGSDEARALAARVDHNWDLVLNAAETWLDAEPFSADPAAMASFASFTFEQQQRAEIIATRGLAANPEDALLLNNRSVARAYQGNTNGALDDVRRGLEIAPASDKNDPVLFATLGLTAYRSGDSQTGRSCYAYAIQILAKERQPRAAALGALFWLREEFRSAPGASTDELFEAVKKAIPRITRGAPSPEIDSMMEALERERGQSSMPFAEPSFTHLQIADLADRFMPGRELDVLPIQPVVAPA